MKKSLSCLITGITCTLLIVSLTFRAHAAPAERETAASRLQAQGLLAGDQNGDLRLEETLTRAQLAVLLSQISVNPEHIAWERGFYDRTCPFDDVPGWARTYVSVCYAHSLMSGYEDGRFGPSDPVTPQMACAVMLRWLNRGGDYAAACEDALNLNLVPASALEGEAISRGNMAVLICRAQNYMARLQDQ